MNSKTDNSHYLLNITQLRSLSLALSLYSLFIISLLVFVCLTLVVIEK